MPDKKSREVAASGTDNRARLLAVAAQRFREKGYAGTTTRELAALVGVQSASLYYHIRKKEDLLYDVCLESLASTQRAVEKVLTTTESPLSKIRALVHAHVQTALANSNEHATMLLELRSLSGERRQEVIRQRETYQSLLTETIADAQNLGAIRSDIPAKYMTLALLNLMNWTIFWYRHDGELSPDELAEFLVTIFIEGASERALLEGGRHESSPALLQGDP